MWERTIRFRHMRNEAEVRRRARAVDFWKTHGLEAAMDAFDVSRPTLFRWQQALAKSRGRLDALDPKSTAPKRKRHRVVDHRIEEYIVAERDAHPRLGKEKMTVFLKDACRAWKIPPPSESTVGRIIHDLKGRRRIPAYRKVSVSAKTGKVIGREMRKYKKKRRVPKDFRPEHAGDLVETDTVVIFIDGVRRYIATAIDRESDFAFAYAYTHLSSTSARDFLRKFIDVAPFTVRNIQTDNGSEFAKYFASEVEALGITHFHTYPRHPKMNAFVERFNRTIQDEFASWRRQTLSHDIERFNHDLMEWLIWYNTKRPHRSLGLVAPLAYIVSTLPTAESQMWWTRTTH